jgi:hypothetical protein
MADLTINGSYISVPDFTSTYTGIDTTTLAAGQLARAIKRASDWVNMICKQILYPTVDTVVLEQDVYPQGYALKTFGFVELYPLFFPIQSISSLSYQYSFGPNITPTVVPVAGNTIIQPRRILVNAWPFGEPLPWAGPLLFNLSYVNGYAIAQLSATANAGQAVLALKPQPGNATVQGFAAGTILEIQDGTPEQVVVLSVSGNNVTLTANLVSQHLADVTVADPKLSIAQQATINIATYLIKERGLGPVALSQSGLTAQKDHGGLPTDLLADCAEMLQDFIAHF